MDDAQHRAAANHISWFAMCARTSGGEIGRTADVTWTIDGGDAPGAQILFPAFSAPDGRGQLDEIVARCRERGGLRNVGCWSLVPTAPAELGAWLLARGFSLGWRPNWMELDLRTQPAAAPAVHGLELGVVAGGLDWVVDDLPYYSPAIGARIGDRVRQSPRTTWYVAGLLDGEPAALTALHLPEDDPTNGGMYEVGVVPRFRRRGVGSAIVAYASRLAADLDARRLTLNSTDQAVSVYRRVGFESVGFGQTWWLGSEVLNGAGPTQVEVDLVEAVATGDLARLDALAPALDTHHLREPLACGSTAVQVGVARGHPESVAWLRGHGALIDVVSAWDLGGQAEATEVLRSEPGLIDHRVAPDGATPLHVAVLRHDLDLARLLLGAGPDLTLTDWRYRSDPLGWARWFGDEEMTALIEAHSSG